MLRHGDTSAGVLRGVERLHTNSSGKRLVYLTCSSAKLDSIELMPASRVSFGLEKLLVGREIGDDDAHQVVARAGHQIAFRESPAMARWLSANFASASSRWLSSLIETNTLTGSPTERWLMTAT